AGLVVARDLPRAGTGPEEARQVLERFHLDGQVVKALHVHRGAPGFHGPMGPTGRASTTSLVGTSVALGMGLGGGDGFGGGDVSSPLPSSTSAASASRRISVATAWMSAASSSATP